MDDERVGRAIRALRQRRGWRQADLAARSGVSQSAISDIERGRLERYTLAMLRRVLRALDAGIRVQPLWGGYGELPRLLDADHAQLVEDWARRHASAGWETWSEASYSLYGERGRIDLLAFHPPTGVLEVCEMKTGIWDLQETTGLLDAKTRLARQVAKARGWAVTSVVPALVVADTRTARRRVAEHPTTFSHLPTRGWEGLRFVREPRSDAAVRVRGLLVFVGLDARGRRAGQQRVRAA